MKAKRGFTLIEVLIALLLSVLVLGLGTQFFIDSLASFKNKKDIAFRELQVLDMEMSFRKDLQMNDKVVDGKLLLNIKGTATHDDTHNCDVIADPELICGKFVYKLVGENLVRTMYDNSNNAVMKDVILEYVTKFEIAKFSDTTLKISVESDYSKSGETYKTRMLDSSKISRDIYYTLRTVTGY